MRRYLDQVGDDFRERSAGIQLVRAALPEERLNPGENEGYTSLAGCLPEDGTVVVVLSNDVGTDLSAIRRTVGRRCACDGRDLDPDPWEGSRRPAPSGRHDGQRAS
jgi:hypothetical protein